MPVGLVEPGTASELNTSITMHLGWRTSYRKSCPEDYNAQEERFRKVLRRKSNVLSEARMQMNRVSTRHKPVLKRNREKQQAQVKARSVALKANRLAK